MNLITKIKNTSFKHIKAISIVLTLAIVLSITLLMTKGDTSLLLIIGIMTTYASINLWIYLKKGRTDNGHNAEAS
jgi:phosphatidylserine synthase